MNKPPAFQFYADDFLAGTMDMSQEEVGAYIRLLCAQWNRGAIPAEPDRVARLAGGSVSVAVLDKFPPGEDGLRRNARMEREREKQTKYRELQAEKGRASALARGSVEPRLEARLNRGSNSVEFRLEPKGNSPSPSPSPSPSLTTSTTPVSNNKVRKHSESAIGILTYLNEKCGRDFRAVDGHLKLISARLSEPGVTEEGVRVMIDRQCALWINNPKMADYLRPQTLFGKEKFSAYYDSRKSPVSTGSINGIGSRPSPGAVNDFGVGGLEGWKEQQLAALGGDVSDLAGNPFPVE